MGNNIQKGIQLEFIHSLFTTMPNRLPFYRSIIFALVAALCLFSWVTSAAGDGDDKTEASRDGAGQAVGFSARQLDRLAIDDEALNELLEVS